MNGDKVPTDQFRLAFRGYHTHDVDALLERVDSAALTQHSPTSIIKDARLRRGLWGYKATDIDQFLAHYASPAGDGTSLASGGAEQPTADRSALRLQDTVSRSDAEGVAAPSSRRERDSKPAWEGVAHLSGRRIVRQQTSRTDYEFRNESGEVLAMAKRRTSHSGSRMGSVMVASGGTYQTVIRGKNRNAIGGLLTSSHLSLEWVPDDPDGTPTVLARQSGASGGASPLFFGRVQSSAAHPFGAISDWHLPNGSALKPFCLGTKKPFRVLMLQATLEPLISVRYLAPTNQGVIGWTNLNKSSNFEIGEAIVSDRLPDPAQLLPMLMFAFEVAQALNYKEGGG